MTYANLRGNLADCSMPESSSSCLGCNVRHKMGLEKMGETVVTKDHSYQGEVFRGYLMGGGQLLKDFKHYGM